MDWSSRLKRVAEIPWLAEGLASLGALLFAIQIWIYAHTQSSSLDEGAYLLKGYLYAIGRYTPFQDYGPWTNHMPLSFLIPGYVQRIFGPGLRTGRYFAVVLGVVMLLGIWLLARRLGNRWWACVAVCLVALNAPLIKIYSVMATQGLVACMLVWVLVLTLGEGRKLWQLLLGTTLAALMMLTRLNMSPVLPFLILYIFWEHGRKKGVWALMVGIVVVVAGNALYWPGILRLWVAWLPLKGIPFFDGWARPEGALPRSTLGSGLKDQVLSFFLAVRLHYFAIVGVVASLLLWPRKQDWRSSWSFKAAIFLSTLFIVMFAFHMWASLGKNYCVYCLSPYVSFFVILGILLVIVSFDSWQKMMPKIRAWLAFVLASGLSMGVGYSLMPVWGSTLIKSRFINRLMHIDVPRVKSFRIQPGSTDLWSLFANKFGRTESEIIEIAIDVSRTASFIFLGLIFGLLIYKFGNWLVKKSFRGTISLTYGGLVAFLILGTLATFTAGLAPSERDCGWDVIASYEAGGAHLAEYIPDGSKVYWWGGLTAVPLLYIPDAELYPAQINHGYSLRQGGDLDELERYGWWSRDLAEVWLQDTDLILIEARLYGGFATSYVERENFDEVSPTPAMVPCRNNSPIHIFVRQQ